MTVSIRVLELGGRALSVLAAVDGDLDINRADREMRRAGCPAALSETLVRMLIEARLLEVVSPSGPVTLTDSARLAAEGLGRQDWSTYAASLLELPWLRDQLHASLSAVDVDAGISLIDRERIAPRWPTLWAVLGWLPNAPGRPNTARLPSNWLDRLHFAPVRAELPDWVQVNIDVGNRAERYSLHLERSRTAPSEVLWVATESDRYGYDIEVREAADSVMAIEVKGSASSRRQFQLTAHEMDVATRFQGHYVVHFWGEIDLGSDMVDEYVRLRSLGYPIEYRDPAALVEAGVLSIQPSTWQVSDSRL